MLFRYFLLGILFFISVDINFLFAQEQEDYLMEYNYYLKAPEQFLALSEDLLLIYDPANNEYPIYLLDMKKEKVISKVRSGRGPGELGEARYKTMMFAFNGNISVFDSGLLQTNIYDQDLNYKQTLKDPDIGKNFMQAGFIDDTTFFGINSGGDFINAFQYKIDDSSFETSPLWTVANSENEYFAPLENFLLTQHILFEQDNNFLYMGFKYSSLLIKVDKEGIAYFTVDPAQDLLPNEKPENGRTYSIPAVDAYPICALDIDVHGDFLYVLYSGEKISDTGAKGFSFGSEIERITHSNKVYKYDKATGKYIGELAAPIQAKNMEITDEYIYLLSFIHDELPTIYKYPFEALSKVSM